MKPFKFIPSNVQARRDFINRETLCWESLVTRLDENNHVILYGMAGIGKSELATQILFRGLQSNKYRAYMWVRADNKESILNDYSRIATNLGLIEGNENPEA